MKNLIKNQSAIFLFACLLILTTGWNNKVQAQCTSTSQDGSQTSLNTGADLTWAQYGGYYETISSVINGDVYNISSSNSSDYITVKTGSAGSSGTVVSKGTSPLSFTATSTTVYVIVCASSGCGYSFSNRTITWDAAPNFGSLSASSGCIGNTITITGTGFLQASEVSFHGTDAVYTVNSATSISATVPTGATTGTITITGPGGSDLSGSFTVNASPGDNSGGDKSTCGGVAVTLGATSTNGHTYKWSPATALSSSTKSNPTASPTVTTVYTLTETITSSGCSTSNSTTVTINSGIGDSAGASQSICSGSSATLGGSSTPGHTYKWSPSTTLSSSTAASPTASPSVTTTYSLTETITATGCSATNSTVVTVNALPVNKTVSVVASSFCSGGSTNVQVASSVSGVSYQLRNNADNSLIGSAVNGTGGTINLPTGALTSTTTFNVLASNTNCSLQMSVTPTVTINAIPGDNSGGDKSYCTGGSVTIGASSTSGHTYKWSPSTALSSSTASNPTASPTITTVYTLTETITSSGCSAANTTTITVNAGPGDSSGASQSICSGSGGMLGGSSTPGHTYKWSPSTALSSSTAASPTATPTVTTTYSLTETITATGCSATNSTVVTVNALPANKTVSAVASSLCSGGSTNVQVASSVSGVSYQLRNNADNSQIGSAVNGTGGTINLPTGALTSATTFNVLASNTNCSLQMSVTPTVTINASPGDNSGGNQSLCTGSSVSLGAGSTAGHTYSWSPSTGLSNAAIANPTANPTVTTVYTLTEKITSTGCSASNSTTVTVNTIPSDSITPSYCNGGGNVQLTVPSAASYVWSNGGTAQSITVNTAGTFAVTVTGAGGCTASNSYTVAVELVTNGNFELGNTGFTSGYTYTSATYTGGSTGLINEGLYAVGTNANNYHPNFFGTDHTTGSGKFMIVNGAGTPVTVWQETVTLIPNTNYYFSAYAMSMNNVSPWAQLKFSINGTQVGTTADLTTGATSTAGPFTWTRFYATWNSGSSTTATLSIVDLQTAAGGNDFGIDDISCSTLSTVPLSATPSTNSPCLGNTLDINSNILGGMMPMTYSWSGPNSFTSSSVNDSILNVTNLAAGIYNLTVTDSHGCTVTAATSSAVINPLPSNNSGNNVSTCSGNGVAIGASSTSGHTYSWSPSTNLSSSTAANPTATPAATATYSLTETISSTGCSVTNSTVVTVNSLPSNNAGSAKSICNGGSVIIGATGTAGHTYKWSPATGLSSTTASNPTASPTVTTTYTLTETITATGCSVANTVVVTVNPIPGNNTGSAKSVCIGAGVAIGASSTAGHTYSWSPSTGLSSSTAANPTATPTITTTYNLTETITATTCAATNSVIVTANPLPGNNSGANQSTCSGVAATIGAAGTAGHTYSWSPSTALSSSTTANPTANPTVTTTYTLTETITATGCTASNSTVVTPNPGPGNNAGSAKFVCSGSGVTIGSSSTAGHTYNWSPAATLSSATVSNPTASPTVNTTYTLTETITASGCSAANSVAVTISSAPTISSQPANQTTCAGGSVTFSITASGATTYQWYENQGSSFVALSNGGNYSGATSQSLTISNTTSAMNGYTYYCIVSSTCTGPTSNTVTLTITSLGQWVGVTSTSWSTSSNWCGGIPDSTTDVVIPSTAPHMPNITVSNAMCHNLTINTGATLTISGSGDLSLYGSLTVNGTYTHTAGTIDIKGNDSTQNIAGITAYNVIIDNANNGITLTGNMTVTNTLTFNNGILNTGTYQVDVTNTSTNSVVNFSSTKYVNGYLMRSVGITGTYNFPVGSSAHCELAILNLTALIGVSNIVANFNVGSMGTPPAGLTSGGNTINTFLNYGYWTIEPDQQPTLGVYSVTLNPIGHTNGGGSSSYVVVKKPHGSSSTSWTAPGVSLLNLVPTILGAVTAGTSGLTSFSDFGAGVDLGTVLPIKLISFTAEKCDNDADALLKWSTATEENNDHFEVEEASDNSDNNDNSGQLTFHDIGEVKGAGNSDVELSYSLVDTEANKSGARYYRLKQVNFDSTFTYSNIVALNFNSATAVQMSPLYPNPVSDMLHFKLTSPDQRTITVTVSNLIGQEIFREPMQVNPGENSMNLDVTQLNKGLFFLSLIDGTTKYVPQKFEKF